MADELHGLQWTLFMKTVGLLHWHGTLFRCIAFLIAVTWFWRSVTSCSKNVTRPRRFPLSVFKRATSFSSRLTLQLVFVSDLLIVSIPAWILAMAPSSLLFRLASSLLFRLARCIFENVGSLADEVYTGYNSMHNSASKCVFKLTATNFTIRICKQTIYIIERFIIHIVNFYLKHKCELIWKFQIELCVKLFLN